MRGEIEGGAASVSLAEGLCEAPDGVTGVMLGTSSSGGPEGEGGGAVFAGVIGEGRAPGSAGVVGLLAAAVFSNGDGSCASRF